MKPHICIPLVCLVLVCGGCATYNEQTAEFRAHWDGGDLESAVELIDDLAECAPNKDKIVVRLEQGTVHQSAGSYFGDKNLFDSSYQAFQIASDLINEYYPDDGSIDSLDFTDETVGNIANMGEMPYRSYVYDRMMMDVYLLLHKLQRKETGKILPGINKLGFRRDSAEEFFKKEIEKDRRDLEKHEESSDNYQVSQARTDATFNSNVQDLITGPSTSSGSPYSAMPAFFNPVAQMLGGIYFLHKGDASVRAKYRQRARLWLSSISNAPSGPLVNQMLLSPSADPYTYVFIERGGAPRREEVRIDIPVYMFAETHVPYAGAAFPKLVFLPSSDSSFSVQATGLTSRSYLLADFDVIVSREFDKRLPGVISRTLASSGTKIMAQYIANKAADEVVKKRQAQGEDTSGALIVQGVVKIFGAVWAATTTRGDMRTWVTLPGKVHVVRTRTPVDGKLILSDRAGGGGANIFVSPQNTNIVYCRIMNGVPTPLVLFNLTL